MFNCFIFNDKINLRCQAVTSGHSLCKGSVKFLGTKTKIDCIDRADSSRKNKAKH